MAVLHQRVPHIAKLGFTAQSLAVKAAVRIGCARVRDVCSFLAIKVFAAVAVVRSIFRFKTLMARPSFDQRAVHGKMLVRQQRLNLGVSQERRHKALENIALLQAFAVLRERRRVPHGRIW